MKGSIEMFNLEIKHDVCFKWSLNQTKPLFNVWPILQEPAMFCGQTPNQLKK